MYKKVAFTMYPVTDMARARDFYENTIGLPFSGESAEGAWIEFDLPGGGCFALTSMPLGIIPSHEAGGSVAFEVDNLKELVEQLKSKGVQFKMDWYESPVCYLSVALDTEGNGFILHQCKRDV